MAAWPKIACSLAAALYLADGPLAAAPPADKEPAKPASASFIRLQRDAQNQPVALQTAVVRYAPVEGKGGVTVDLIGAIHIGDRAYYQQLNELMEQYDVLLYELVAPPGTRIPKGGRRGDGPLAVLQKAAKIALELDLQTEQIDYTRKNFVHADLSPEQMAEAVRKRGDDGVTLFLGIATDVLRNYNRQEQQRAEKPAKAEEEETDFLSLLLDADGPVKMKRLMAEQLAGVGTEDGLGETLNTILIKDRNLAALKVLQKEMARGKKKIGIFYGVGHLPDLDRRLRADFDLKRTETRWLTAWEMRVSKRKAVLDLLKLFDD